MNPNYCPACGRSCSCPRDRDHITYPGVVIHDEPNPLGVIVFVGAPIIVGVLLVLENVFGVQLPHIP